MMTSGDATEGASIILEVLAGDGRVERSVEIGDGPFSIGRAGEGLSCPDDDQMARHHARLERQDGALQIADTGEGSGVWLRIRGADGRRLESEDQLWLGAQILVVRQEESGWQLRHHGPSGRLVAVHRMPATGIFIGRSSDLVLDPGDTRLSRRHAQIVHEGAGLRFYDRGAHNGSFVRLTRQAEVSPGDEFRLATQRFRIALAPASVAAPPEQPRTQDPAEPLARQSAPKQPDAARPSLASRLRRMAREQHADAVSPPDPSPAAAVPPEPLHDPSPAARERPEPERPGAGDADELSDTARERSEALSDTVRERPESLRDTLREQSTNVEEIAPAPGDEPVGDAVDLVEEPTIVSVPSDGEGLDVGETLRAPRPDAPSRGEAGGAGGETEASALLVIDTDEESVSLEVEPGTTVLEAIRAAGIERGRLIDWECEDGGCGVCVMGVVEGADRLDPPDPGSDEMKTIQITEQVAPDPNRYRLACLARVRGTVRLRRL
jgi:ferredoxin/pSer/pThr/pTyr-binding forkhead associated (FHA) protein